MGEDRFQWNDAPAANTNDRFQWDAAPAAAPAAAPQAPTATMDSGQHGFRGWIQSVEDDIRYGSDNTLIGKALKKLGASGVDVGAQAGTQEDALASPMLGATKFAKGAVDDVKGTLTANPHLMKQGAQGMVGGALQASSLPAAFVAPEAGEAGAEVAATGASKAARGVGRTFERAGLKATPEAKAAVKTASNPSIVANAERTVGEINEAALPELHSGIHNALDSVGSNAANEITQTLKEVGGTMDQGAANALSNAASSRTLSEKADYVGQAMRSSAQQIYQKLDEMGGGGRFQRYAETIKQLEDELKNPALMGEPKIQLQNSLTKAQQEFDAFKTEMTNAGLSDKVIKMADKLWSKGASLDEWSRKLLGAEDMVGNLKSGAKPLNNAVRDLTAKASPRGHVLKNGMGAQADEIKSAVQKASDTIQRERGVTAQAKKTVRAGKRAQSEIDRAARNRKVVGGVIGAGALFGAGADVAKNALFGDKK